MRFDVKTGGNLDGDQNQNKKRSLSQFDLIFVRILGGDQSKRKRFDLISCKISLQVHIKTYGPRSEVLGRPAFDFKSLFGYEQGLGLCFQFRTYISRPVYNYALQPFKRNLIDWHSNWNDLIVVIKIGFIFYCFFFICVFIFDAQYTAITAFFECLYQI